MSISLIIPTYNRAKILELCLNNLRKMEGIYEIVIIDDASDDNTNEIVENFKKELNIVYVKNKKNLGALKSEQIGLKKARGNYVTFLADDDRYIDNNFFKKAIQYNEDIISAKYETVLNGKVIKNDFYSKKEILNSNEALKIFNQFAYGGNTIFKKELLLEIMKYNFRHDYSIIFLSLLKAKKIRFINEVVFYWYLDTNKETFTSNLLSYPYDLLTWDKEFLDEIVPVLKREGLYEKYKWFINKKVFDIFENVEFNYYLTNRKDYFSKILAQLDAEVYIYGYGQIGVELKEFLENNGKKVLGFIDDFKQNCVKFDEIDKSKKIIIATFKKSVIHKMYRNLIEHNIDYKNIVELI